MSVTAVILCEKRGCVAGGALRLSRTRFGVLAQLVERLNGIEEVRGSNPLGSTSFVVQGVYGVYGVYAKVWRGLGCERRFDGGG